MIVGAVALLGMVFLLIVWMMEDDAPTYYAHSLRNWQEADAVAGHPMVIDPEAKEPSFWTAEFEPRLHVFREVERYQLPIAEGFIHPMGDFVKVEEASRTSVRFNSPAGGVLGVGELVYAAGTGRVVYANPKTKVLILAHRTPDDRVVTTIYANIEKFKVRTGSLVARGHEIGEIAMSVERPGLIFEVREAVGIDTPEHDALNHLAPLEFLKKNCVTSRWPDALSVKRANGKTGIESLQFDAESAQKLGEKLAE